MKYMSSFSCFYNEYCVCALSDTVVSDSLSPMDSSPPGSSDLGVSRQESRSGLPVPPPGGLLNAGTEFVCLVSPALAGGILTVEPPGKPDDESY